MGEIVSFPSNGGTCGGYLALPPGDGPGLVVIQEWWGLVDHIKEVADRFADEGFVALAPDLYHGATTREPDEAQKLMMDLNIEEAAKDMGGAVDYLLGHDRVHPKRIGSVGFCMGGALSLVLGTRKPVDAVVAYYGLPSGDHDWDALSGAVLGHFPEHDGWASPEAGEALMSTLREKGKDATGHAYPGTDHAFFNDTRPEVHDADASALSWQRTLEFFRANLSG